MPFEFRLPDLGEGITEGEIRRWLVKEGDSVEEHQNVLEVETDKAIVEVPSPRKGRILRINKAEGEMARVGDVLMAVSEDGEAPAEAPEAKTAEQPRAEVKTEAVEEKPKSVSVVGVLPEEEEEILAPPAVRALARERRVKLETLKGTGPGGSITKEDVLKASEEARRSEEQLYGPAEKIPLKGIRRTIAKNMISAQRATAFVTGMDEADITELWQLRSRERKAMLDKGIHLTFLPFFIKAVYHALQEHPMLNASIDDLHEEITIKKYYNFGIAVDTPDGLMVPVIRNADRKSILELAAEIQELSVKARERRIKLEEMKGSTFSITNYGHFGGMFATPIINHPDTAILGTGRISDKPWVVNGQIAVRKILPLSLTFDHRITDGVDAARFITKLMSYLEDPALLFVESA
ncbi:MAG TPA: dihydrolipoamide acetyltransferase family protein [Dissulfurispiraceae bacterium]